MTDDGDLRARLLRKQPGAPAVKTDTVEIEGIGTVHIRSMSRWEVIHVFSLAGKRQKQEQAALSFAVVHPSMTEDEIGEWQRVPGSHEEIDRVAEAINRLSGIGKAAAKSEVPGDGDEPGTGV